MDKVYYKIDENRLFQLLAEEAHLNALFQGGVDNWEWYSDSVQNYLDDFMGKTEFFIKNPAYRFMVLDWHIQERMGILCNAVYLRDKLPPYSMDQIFRQELGSTISSDALPLASYFFSVSGYQKCFIQKMAQEKNQLQQKIAELEKQLAQNKLEQYKK